MAQQDIIIGPNDGGAGDTPPVAFQKTQDNFTELYSAIAKTPNNVIVINAEEDFPVQTASTITLDSDTGYFIGDNVTTSKSFIGGGATIYSYGAAATAQLTYTGVAPMFTISNDNVYLRDIVVNCPNSTFISATGLGAFNPGERINLNNVEVQNCAKVLDVTSLGGGVVMGSCLFSNVTGLVAMSFAGSGTLVIDMQQFVIGGLLASSVALDFGTATANRYEITNFIPVGDASATPISGAASSGNINSGGLMIVRDCSFSGFTTPLSGISVDDIRVDFVDNTGLLDSKTFANYCLDALSSPETITTGAAGTYARLSTTNYSVQSSSRWSVTTAGVATFAGERTTRIKITGFASLTNAGGGSDLITVRIAKNWTGSADAGLPCSGGATDSNNPASIPIAAETEVDPGDEIVDIYSNLSNGSNIEISAITILIEEL